MTSECLQKCDSMILPWLRHGFSSSSKMASSFHTAAKDPLLIKTSGVVGLCSSKFYKWVRGWKNLEITILLGVAEVLPGPKLHPSG